jgi:hypothetical protein
MLSLMTEKDGRDASPGCLGKFFASVEARLACQARDQDSSIRNQRESLHGGFTFGVSDFSRCHPEAEQSGAEGSASGTGITADPSLRSG